MSSQTTTRTAPMSIIATYGRLVSSKVRFFLFFALLLSVTGTSGCGPALDKDGPRVTSFSFDKQFPGDPYTAIFVFSFSSTDGSMGRGKAQFFVGSKTEPVTMQMSDLMSAVELPRNSTSGEVAAALRFSDDVPDGANVRMGLVLVDENDRKSNRK